MKKLQFPTAHTVLLIIAAFVALLTWFIPSGKFEQLEYKKNIVDKSIFIHQTGSDTKKYPVTQKTIDKFGLQEELAEFKTKDTIVVIKYTSSTITGTLQYQKKIEDKSIFIHHTDSSAKEYPATQKTLSDLGLKVSINKFTDGAIWKPIGIPGTYYEIESNPQGFFAFIQSPLKGMSGAIDVILFVLIIGGFIGIINYTGAFDAGISSLAKNMKGREALLIVIITCLVALGGTTFGLAEETIAFYPILVPVFLAAGYDAMVALGAIYIGSSIGTMASTVNPFSAIIASDSAGINWTSGLYGRIFMLVAGTAICLWYIIRYAEKVRKDPTQSLIYDQKEEIEALFLYKKNNSKLDTAVNTIPILFIFFFSFVVMIWGVSSQGWWFLEMTTVFFIGAILIGIVGKLKEKEFVKEFVNGANDLLGVALIIGIARGITVLMDDGAISDTLLYYASGTVEGMPKWLFANVMMFLYAGLSFFIPSSSGMAVLSMPVMAPLADVVGAPREVVVDAYQFGMGLMAFITPTGLILASLVMVNVTYDKWLKFVTPLLIILTLFSMLFLTVKVYL